MKRRQFGNCPACNRRFPLADGGKVKDHVRPGTREPCVARRHALPATELPKWMNGNGHWRFGQ